MTEQVLEALIDGIAVLDARGVVTYANPAAIAFGVAVGSAYEVPLEDTLVGGRVISATTTPSSDAPRRSRLSSSSRRKV